MFIQVDENRLDEILTFFATFPMCCNKCPALFLCNSDEYKEMKCEDILKCYLFGTNDGAV